MKTPAAFGAEIAHSDFLKSADGPGFLQNYGHYLYDNMIGMPSRAGRRAGAAISGAAGAAKDGVVSAGKDLYDFAADPALRTRTVAALGQNADKYLGTNTGMDPNAVTARDIAPVAKAQRAVVDTAKATPAVAYGFASGFHPDNNPGVRFVDRLTDPNVGVSGMWRENVTEPWQRNVVDPLMQAKRELYDPVKKMIGELAGTSEPTPSGPPAAPPKPITAGLQSYGSGLKDWAGKNPYLAGGLALGLGGLGAYGLYDLLRSRRRRKRQPYYDYDAREF
jgi:hypothetical protein